MPTYHKHRSTLYRALYANIFSAIYSVLSPATLTSYGGFGQVFMRLGMGDFVTFTRLY